MRTEITAVATLFGLLLLFCATFLKEERNGKIMKCQKIAALVLAAGSILNTLPAFAQETSVYEIKSKEDLFALKE